MSADECTPPTSSGEAAAGTAACDTAPTIATAAGEVIAAPEKADGEGSATGPAGGGASKAESCAVGLLTSLLSLVVDCRMACRSIWMRVRTTGGSCK